MKDGQEYVQDPTEDLRGLYAASVVADLEAYAKKHGLFLGKKEYVETDTWVGYDGTQHRRDKLQLDAILFSGIVSAINGLEYVIIYHSHIHKLEFCMNRPDRRETYANGKGQIYAYNGNTGTDLMTGNEFRSFRKTIYELGEQYGDFGKLLDGKWTEHVSEGALDGLMAAFKAAEAKHARRQKNLDSLELKRDRIRESEDALPSILDVLTPMVGGREVFRGYTRYITASAKYPVRVDTTLVTGIKHTRLTCSVDYTRKRDKFMVQIRLNTGIECEILSDTFANWCAEGSLETVAGYIKFALGVAGIYDETARKVAALKSSLIAAGQPG